MNTSPSTYALGVAFASGAAIAGIAYAFVSIYGFGVYERAWGAGGSFQVVVMLGIVAAVLCGSVFGTVLNLLSAGTSVLKTLRPRMAAAIFGAVGLFGGGGLTLLAQVWTSSSLLYAAAAYVCTGILAAIIYRLMYVVPKHAAG